MPVKIPGATMAALELLPTDEEFLTAAELGERLKCTARRARDRYDRIRLSGLKGGRWLWSEVVQYDRQRGRR